ncbi:YcjF family protein [Cognatishimia sp. F0-27]|uniref:YcjF family protein n=1 Tax=Cognatishimia sp. F0-27 TaxID=2816855 RepID=UPI001D0CD427|nr:TIGR01620 family protein [Cognatishimia sp. F0-27]MCC1491947.1 TIGR01620 family protein [Cognatishimia sp. F0-27]
MSDDPNCRNGPVLIELGDADEGPSPAEAPAIPDLDDQAAPQGQAMATVAALTARQPSMLARWFWRLLVALIGTIASISAWNFAAGLVATNPVLGWAVSGLIAAFVLVMVLIAIKEIAAFSRLAQIDSLHHAAAQARADEDLTAAREVSGKLVALYRSRDDTRWGRERLAEREAEVFDAPALLDLTERELLAQLDSAARREVEAAARQVATVTALVPLAFADVAAAFGANLRMIRRVAEIYGGRSGTLGTWRLTRAVMAHLVATGAVAVGDDMLEPVLGGGLLGKLSRRFGEGLVNGALTARVGVATMEVCRPLPFSALERPSARGIVRGALGGLFRSETAER